jgi:hypothetical protein
VNWDWVWSEATSPPFLLGLLTGTIGYLMGKWYLARRRAREEESWRRMSDAWMRRDGE